MRLMCLQRGILVLTSALLSGCFDSPEPLAKPAMAVAPGYIRLDSGKQIQVIGYERCPGSGYSMVGRVVADNMRKHCTLISEGASHFEISVGTSIGVVVERWSVVADSRSVRLLRPDGDGATVFRIAD